MLTGTALAGRLEAAGFDFFTGVPCSLVEDLIAALTAHPRLPYVPAVREDVALGLAAGAWMAGRTPAVLMQNSGLGTGLNALASLSLLYRLPALLLVTWRGWQGRDAPEHLLMGEITPRLLDLLGIAHRLLGADPDGDLAWARSEALRLEQPVALLVPPGVLEAGSRHDAAPAAAAAALPSPAAAVAAARAARGPAMSRLEALRAAVSGLRAEPVIHANGYICRESFAVKDRPENFYMIGSMGLASAIALGIALARPGLRPVVFDGDGNLLMALGILAMVGGGAAAPAARAGASGLIHVVFDNGVYGSTGNQPSPAAQVPLERLAAAAGYRQVAAVEEAADLGAALDRALAGPGPAFILARVSAEQAAVPRIPWSPVQIRDRFRRALGGGVP